MVETAPKKNVSIRKLLKSWCLTSNMSPIVSLLHLGYRYSLEVRWGTETTPQTGLLDFDHWLSRIFCTGLLRMNTYGESYWKAWTAEIPRSRQLGQCLCEVCTRPEPIYNTMIADNLSTQRNAGRSQDVWEPIHLCRKNPIHFHFPPIFNARTGNSIYLRLCCHANPLNSNHPED